MITIEDYCLKIIILDKKMGRHFLKSDEPNIRIYHVHPPVMILSI